MVKSNMPGYGEALVTRPLSSDDWPVVEKLFGDKGACGGCWCMWWRLPRGGKLWEESKGAKNKRAFKRLVTSGKASGCLAFAGEEPVGWCCVGPRADFPRIKSVKALATEWNEDTWSVLCFYIPSRHRHRGVATALLAEAVRFARAQGAETLEGYPIRIKPVGKEVPGVFAWTGIPRLFEKQKFSDVTPPGNSRPIYVKRFRRRRAESEAKRR